MIRGFGRWRGLVAFLQAVIMLGLPFLKIRGESALRFDIPSLRLHVFGATLWMDEFFIVLVALIFVTFLIILVTIVFGRVWCGWLCPQTVISDITGFVDEAGTVMGRTGSYFAVLAASVIIAASMIWYFVSPYEFIPDLILGQLGRVTWGFWIVLTILVFLDFAFLRRTWCATVCPYAKLQGTLFDRKTLIIAFDGRRQEECMDCRACVRVCPVAIDIRKGLQTACISCAACIDTCSRQMERKKSDALIGYFFGRPGEAGNLMRTSVFLFGAATALFFLFFIYLMLARVPVDMTVLPNTGFKPVGSRADGFVNSYTLALQNRGRIEIDLKIAAKASEVPLTVIPDRITLGAGKDLKLPIYVRVRPAELPAASQDIVITLESGEPERIRLDREAVFLAPRNP